jgi:hypothetical protein
VDAQDATRPIAHAPGVDLLNPASNPTGFTVFIFVIIGLSLVWRFKWQQGLLTGGMKDGVPTTAVITGMGQTGMEINNQPQLTFELLVSSPAGGAPYAASVRQTVPNMALGMLRPGATVGVVVSPKDPSKVKLDLQGTANMGAAAAAGQFGVMGAPAPAPSIPGVPGMGLPQVQVRSNDELVATGEPVAVTVVSVQETGQLHGADPIVMLQLQVHAPAGAYQVQAGYRVPTDKRAKLAPSVVLRGHMVPGDPNALGIDWRAL